MTRRRLEVADVFRMHRENYCDRYGPQTSAAQWRVMRAIEICRTAALGGHVDQCDSCGHQVISYNSCRNRHCPKCQSLAKERWLQARRAELLPVEYYHVVFTLPAPLAAIAQQNKKAVYDMLFAAVSQTLRTIASDPRHLGAEIGFIAVLHTWGQNLMHHPHVHCVIPGGGLAPDGKSWIACRQGFFLPVRVLSRLFRRLFVEALRKAGREERLEFHGSLKHLRTKEAFAQLLNKGMSTEWVVYAKPPLGGPENTLDYLARYTHRVAISNNRLIDMKSGKVTFALKNYQRQGKREQLTLDAAEFIRRFLLHVLPDGFRRIRHFGFLANRHRVQKLELCLALLTASEEPDDTNDSGRSAPQNLDWPELILWLTGLDPLVCPRCRRGRLLRMRTLDAAAHAMPAHARASPRKGA